MTDLVSLMDDFERDIVPSIGDSILRISRRFALAQTKMGDAAAIQALATAYVTAESRRRHLEATSGLNQDALECS